MNEKFRLTSKLAVLLFISMTLIKYARADDVPPPPPPPPPGFPPGQRTFNNPFANTPDTVQEDPFLEEEEFIDSGDGGNFEGNNIGSPSNSGSPISGGGTPSTTRAQGAPKEPASIRINDETGEGSKEVVTDFNFPDAEIMDIAKTLGKLTGKNFILDKNVKGRVTIISNSPITVGDAWKAFLTALDINGFTLIPSGKYIRVARQRDARDKQLRTYTGSFSPNTDAMITRVFQLRYIGSEEVARTFRSFMPANSRIIPHEQTNTVIVTDTGANVEKLAKMLEILDVEGFDIGIEVISVKYASAVELSKLIDQLLPGNPATGPGGRPRPGANQFAARRTKEGGVVNAIISDERTNSLIVHANNMGYRQVKQLLEKLDRKVPITTAGGKVHVIYLQFGVAEEIATTLNNLSQGAVGARPATPSGAGGTGVNPTTAALFQGSIRISADKSTNSLVVTASPSDFATIQRVVARLDIPRDEVYVEAVIMELSTEDLFSFSANMAMPGKGIGFLPSGKDLADFITSPLGSKGLVLGLGKGETIKVPMNGTTVEVKSVLGLIKALQTNAKANILATPQILTMDNTEAEFESGETIPVSTSTIGQGGAVSASVSPQKISLKLKIKPQINKTSNFVKMEITANMQDFSSREVSTQVAAQGGVATIERNTKTSVFVADNDTVVLGGLVRDNQTKQVSKIPLLGDIPLLGWLFRSSQTVSRKTNLLIFITPQIVRQYDRVRAILDKKLKERDNFIEANNGGEDVFRTYRDDMIRSLPDLKLLKNRKPTIQNNDQEVEPDADDLNSVAPSAEAAPAQNSSQLPNAASQPVNPAGLPPPPPPSAPDDLSQLDAPDPILEEPPPLE